MATGICADPFRGVRPAGGAKDKGAKKKVPTKVRKNQLNLEKPLAVASFFSQRALNLDNEPGPSHKMSKATCSQDGGKSVREP